MKDGSVVVDVAIDQGGNMETSEPTTTHDNPVYIRHGVIHYTVSNMPGAVPRTSTIGLTNVTVPYALLLANKGYRKACLDNEALRKGVNTLDGYVTFEAIASAHNMEYKDVLTLLK